MLGNRNESKFLGLTWLFLTLPVFASFGVVSLTWSIVIAGVWVCFTTLLRRKFSTSLLATLTFEPKRLTIVGGVLYSLSMGAARVGYDIMSQGGLPEDTSLVFAVGTILGLMIACLVACLDLNRERFA
jgi:hypothetical protein